MHILVFTRVHMPEGHSIFVDLRVIVTSVRCRFSLTRLVFCSSRFFGCKATFLPCVHPCRSTLKTLVTGVANINCEVNKNFGGVRSSLAAVGTALLLYSRYILVLLKWGCRKYLRVVIISATRDVDHICPFEGKHPKGPSLDRDAAAWV